jgi:hypothetical protein
MSHVLFATGKFKHAKFFKNIYLLKASRLSSMSFPPAKKISQNEFADILSMLDFLLANLPAQLPSGDGSEYHYHNFLSFGLDSDILEKTGDEVYPW